MLLQKDKSVLNNYTEAIQHEWLETNGLGGWAGSSIIGCNTRRYHSLLMAATVPPAERTNLINKLDELIIINDERYELGTNNYGDAIVPQGYQYLSSFKKELFPKSPRLRNVTFAVFAQQGAICINYCGCIIQDT